MAGRLKAGDRLSGTEKEQVKRNASIPKELDNSAGRSSESLSPTDKEGGWKVAEIISLDKEDVPKDFDLMRESLIVKAVDRFLEEDAGGVSDGEDLPRTFSQDYEARKQKMLQTAFEWDESKSMTKPKRRFRIPAAAAAAAAVLVVTASLSVTQADAMPEPIRVLVMQVQSLFSSASVDDQIQYADNQATDFPTEIETVYEPTMVLDGYEESERLLHDKVLQVYYTNVNGQEYSFQQRTLDYKLNYDYEDIDYENIQLYGELKGIVYEKNSQRHLQWQQNGYVFEFIGTQTFGDLTVLAASVRSIKE
ncbi:DUF4367 domain-containing protein [Frisingicoccus sp.]|uniref:DUF4367 domain-containing protein n=1 Tax=Frisingicoccus sp. TaxID=1918627 RepID=UPI003AB52543